MAAIDACADADRMQWLRKLPVFSVGIEPAIRLPPPFSLTGSTIISAGHDDGAGSERPGPGLSGLQGSGGEPEGGANIVAGYQWSIMFMMAMPFTILGLFCGYMYWEVKKAHALQEARKAQQAKATAQQSAATAATSSKELAETAG